jgi:hypothetical protein
MPYWIPDHDMKIQRFPLSFLTQDTFAKVKTDEPALCTQPEADTGSNINP